MYALVNRGKSGEELYKRDGDSLADALGELVELQKRDLDSATREKVRKAAIECQKEYLRDMGSAGADIYEAERARMAQRYSRGY
jgi:cobalamin biosynthesis protein CobD/CbiB